MRNPKFNALIDEILQLHDSKSHDYTPEGDPLNNLRRAKAFGIDPVKGVLVRLSDKWSRIEQLATGKTPKHESLRDSLIDNAVYSLLAVVLLDEQLSAGGKLPNLGNNLPDLGTNGAVYVPDGLGVPANVP